MQGRFKRDGKAAADPEPRGSNDRDSAPQRVRDGGQAASSEGSEQAKESQTQPQDAGSTGKEPGAGSRLALRNWRISTRLISLVTLPVVAATSFGAYGMMDSREEVQQLENMKLLTEITQQATELAAALQEERDRSAGPMTAHGNAKDDAIVAPRERTDQAKKAFDDQTKDLSDQDTEQLAGVRATVVHISGQLHRMKEIRERAYENPDSIADTVGEYNRIIQALLALSQDMAQATSNPEMISNTRALAAFSTAKEYASIQRAVISAGLANPDGPELSETDRRYGGTASDNESAAIAGFSVIYGDGAAELTKTLGGGIVNITSADEYAARVFKSSDGIKAEQRSYMDWYDQDRTKIDEMAKIETTLLTEMEQLARELHTSAQRDVIISATLIVLVLGISLVGAFVVARSMVRSLRRLQDTAQEVSRKRLPDLVRQLSESDPQEVDTTVQSIGVHSRDEIGQVAAAFDDVHREAVRLAGEQALLRGNVNAMFTNLSRRSQSLIQRQLSLISELESREADPDQLASLFKLDHLATRMRRNGENLLVLAGEEPGRRWTRPVPLVDVLRAAASEVEQYERIELSGVPTAEVTGRVVNDLVHLLAELLENATSFSSPQTKVKVTGHALPDGRVLVEIHDTGIGLSPEDLAEINERLNSPPTVDVSVSRRMGLFVVGRLSLRHGIRIQLRPSDSGGTTALVMLPVDITRSAQAPKGKTGPGPAGAPAPRLQKPQGGTPGTSRLGALPTRGQVSGGSRPALPGAGGSRQGPGGSRQGPGGSPQGAGGTPKPSLFGPRPQSGGAPPSRPPQPAAPAPAPSRAQESLEQGGNGRPPQLPARPGPVGALPSRDTRRPEQGERPGAPPLPSRRQPVDPQGTQPPQGFEAFRESQAPGPQGPGAGNEGPQRPSWASSEDTGATGQGTGRFAEETPREHEDPESTSQFALPGLSGAPGDQPASRQDEREQPGYRTHGTSQDDTTALDIPIPSTATAQTRTPIFEQMESNWFSTGASHEAEATAQEPDSQAGHGSGPGTVAEPEGPGRPGGSAFARSVPSQQPTAPGGGQGQSRGGWQPSPNDDRWRRAERLRQPAAGGVTTSGLPRRVPKANLVEGTAQQQTATSGPQVSRAPDAVRGRLTNLRRGIQQGRQAGGTSGGNERGVGPTYQQER